MSCVILAYMTCYGIKIANKKFSVPYIFASCNRKHGEFFKLGARFTHVVIQLILRHFKDHHKKKLRCPIQSFYDVS